MNYSIDYILICYVILISYVSYITHMSHGIKKKIKLINWEFFLLSFLGTIHCKYLLTQCNGLESNMGQLWGDCPTPKTDWKLKIFLHSFLDPTYSKIPPDSLYYCNGLDVDFALLSWTSQSLNNFGHLSWRDFFFVFILRNYPLQDTSWLTVPLHQKMCYCSQLYCISKRSKWVMKSNGEIGKIFL